MPLAELFLSILNGEGSRVQRRRFGHSTADTGRKQIVQTISQYAQQTGNWSLLNLLDRIQNPDARQPPPAPEPSEPELSPDERDFRSIVDVLEKNNRSVSMAVLGKSRRRWMERPPRDPTSPYPNRLYDVLAKMVANGVLLKQGTRYVPGPDYAAYLGTPDLVGA
jgi:hypothetical protein